MVGMIYIARNKTNGKCYVGQTHRSVRRRMNEHFRDPRKNHAFDLAFRKYGPAAFDIITVYGVPSELLDQWESFFISALNTLAPNGYNLTTGGNGGLRSDETRAKNRDRSIGFARHNKPHSQETKDLIRSILTGRKPTPEQVEKMRMKKVGVPKSEKAKAATRESWVRRRLMYGPTGRRVSQ